MWKLTTDLKIENKKITFTASSAAWQIPLGGHKGG